MESVHPILQCLINAAPYINKMRENGYMVGITDRKKSLIFIPNNIIDIHLEPNALLPSDDPMLKVMKTGQPLQVKVPKDLYGVPFKAYYRPVKDEKGEIIGGFALGRELKIEEHIMEISEALSESIYQINNAVENIAKGSQTQEETSHKMVDTVNNASTKYDETDDIINFIKNVSNQTNLLSLNAQIEAARVGNEGKGFAVVANEMKKLGNNTNEAVNNIGNLILEIKESSEQVKDLVGYNSSITQEQAAAIEEILASMQQLSSSISTLKEIAAKL